MVLIIDSINHYINLKGFWYIYNYSNFKYIDILSLLALASNNYKLIGWLFSNILNDQKLSNYIFLLILISIRFQEPKIGYINKYNFLTQLKDKKSNVSQFFYWADKFLMNDVT